MWNEHPPEIESKIPSSRKRFDRLHWLPRHTTHVDSHTVCDDSSYTERNSRTSCASYASQRTSVSNDAADDSNLNVSSVTRDAFLTQTVDMQGLALHDDCTRDVDLTAILDDVTFKFGVTEDIPLSNVLFKACITASARGSNLWRSRDAGWRARSIEVAIDAMRSVLLDVSHVLHVLLAMNDIYTDGASTSQHITHDVEWANGICWGGDASYDPLRDGRISLCAFYTTQMKRKDGSEISNEAATNTLSELCTLVGGLHKSCNVKNACTIDLDNESLRAKMRFAQLHLVCASDGALRRAVRTNDEE